MYFAHSETPWYVGRAVAALASDPDVAEKSGGAYASWTLHREYGFTDRDGSQPDFGAHLQAFVADLLARVARAGGVPSLDSVEREVALREVRTAVSEAFRSEGLGFILDAAPTTTFGEILELGPDPDPDDVVALVERRFGLG